MMVDQAKEQGSFTDISPLLSDNGLLKSSESACTYKSSRFSSDSFDSFDARSKEPSFFIR